MIGELAVNISAETRDFSAGIMTVKTGLTRVSDGAGVAQFNLQNVAKSLAAVASAGNTIGIVSQKVGVLGTVAGTAAIGFQKAASATGMLSTLAFTAASGLTLLLKPLAGLAIIPKLAAGAFSVMWSAITVPFKAAWTVIKMLTKGVTTLLAPVFMLAKAIFKVKFFFASLSIQMAVLQKAFSLMSPRVRMVVGGLIAVGAAGRLGAGAMRLFGAATSAALIATNLITNPLRGLGMLALSTASGFVRLAVSVTRVTKALVRFAIAKTVAGMKALGSAVNSVAGTMATKFTGAISTAAKTFAGLLVVATGWGIKLAADAEQAQVAFQTMLKSADAAKFVLAELEQFAASTPFKLDSLRDGAKQLLNAQVPTTELTNKLRMLGDIAAGTGKPIGDFVRIFSKVKSTGKVSLETLNQLAERGVPIYSALQSQLGKSRTEMLSMISKGKIGFSDLNAALEATATGTGVFAGGMKSQSLTISGLWSTLTDNMGFAARELGTQMLSAFNFKNMLNQGIGFFQSLKSGIAGAVPVFTALAATVRTAFTSMWEVGTVVMTAIGDAMGVNSGNIMESILTALGVAKYVFREWPTLAELAFKQMALHAIVGFNTITHFFTGVLPSLFSWFGRNWFDLFKTAGTLVFTVFQNIGKNIVNAMSAIWDYIKSGGTQSLSIAWVPLLDGFKSTIKELPDIPKRAIGSLEKQMSKDVTALANRVGVGMGEEIAKNLDMLKEFRSEESKKPDPLADVGTLPDSRATDDPDAASQDTKTQKDSFAGFAGKGSDAGAANDPQIEPT